MPQKCALCPAPLAICCKDGLERLPLSPVVICPDPRGLPDVHEMQERSELLTMAKDLYFLISSW